jgi:hypothetical protein
MYTGARRAAKKKVKKVNAAKSSCDMPGERAPNDGKMQISTRFDSSNARQGEGQPPAIRFPKNQIPRRRRRELISCPGIPLLT